MNAMNLDITQLCYIGSEIRWVSTLLLFYHIISHENLKIDKEGDKVCFPIIIRWN